MTLTIAWVPVALFGLASLRVIGMTLVAPGWSWVPIWIRGIIALWLTFALTPIAITSTAGFDASWLGWTLGAIMALGTGLVLGSVLAFAFAALTTGGQLITSMLGVELSGTTQAGIISASSGFSSWLTWLGLLVFLQQGGLDAMVLALRASLIALPLTHLGIPQDGWTYLGGLFASLLAMACLVALPVVAAVLAIIFLVAVLSRAYPQLQVYFLTSPLMMLGAVVVLWAITPILLPVLENFWQQTWTQMSHVLALWQAGR